MINVSWFCLFAYGISITSQNILNDITFFHNLKFEHQWLSKMQLCNCAFKFVTKLATQHQKRRGGILFFTINEDCGYRWRGTSSRFMGKHKGIFHKYWHTHQLPGRLSRPPPPASVSGLCHESGLRIAWSQPPPALPVWPVCQQRRCARHTFTVQLSRHSGGRGSDRREVSDTYVYT